MDNILLIYALDIMMYAQIYYRRSTDEGASTTNGLSLTGRTVGLLHF